MALIKVIIYILTANILFLLNNKYNIRKEYREKKWKAGRFGL